MWSTVEQSIGIICACLPTLRPLFGKLFANSTSGGNGATTVDARYGHSRRNIAPIALGHLGSKGGMMNTRKSWEGSSTVEFVRLEEGLGEVGDSGEGNTTYVGRSSKPDLRVVPQATSKNQTVEPHFDQV